MVRLVCFVDNVISVLSVVVLRNIPVVIALHLEVKDFRGSIFCVRREGLLDSVDDLVADFVKFSFDFLLELLQKLQVSSSVSLVFGLFFLFLAVNNPPGGSLGSDGVFVGNREEISFLRRKFLRER